MTDYDLLIRQADELARDNVWDITLYANIFNLEIALVILFFPPSPDIPLSL